jgi:hypothetical protein
MLEWPPDLEVRMSIASDIAAERERRDSAAAPGASNVIPLPHRADRFLNRLDTHLATLPSPEQRAAFLKQIMAGLNWRYAQFICTEGRSEPDIPVDDPPHASDFLLMITGVAVRLRGGA